MRLHLRGSAQRQRIGVINPSHPACGVSSISGENQTVNAAPHWHPSPLMPQPLRLHPGAPGCPSPDACRGAPAGALAGGYLPVLLSGVSLCFLAACSFLLVIHWACKAGENTECRGACVCGCQDAAAPTVRRASFFGMPMHGAESGVRCRRSTCRRAPVETTTAPASLLGVCQRINGGNETTRHAAATHSFDDTQRPTLAFFSIGTDHNLLTTPRPRRP